MKFYEGMFIFDTLQSNKDLEGLTEHIHNILKGKGAEVLKSLKWSERKLAYPVNKKKRGIYFLVYFKSDPSQITNIKKECELSERIMRSLILLRNEGLVKKAIGSEETSKKEPGPIKKDREKEIQKEIERPQEISRISNKEENLII